MYEYVRIGIFLTFAPVVSHSMPIQLSDFRLQSEWTYGDDGRSDQIIGQVGGDLFVFDDIPLSRGAGILTLEARGDYGEQFPTVSAQTGPRFLDRDTFPAGDELDLSDEDRLEGLAFGFNCQLIANPDTQLNPTDCAGQPDNQLARLGMGLHYFGVALGAGITRVDDPFYDVTIRQQFIVAPSYMREITSSGMLSFLFFPVFDAIDSNRSETAFFSFNLQYEAARTKVSEPTVIHLLMSGLLLSVALQSTTRLRGSQKASLPRENSC